MACYNAADDHGRHRASGAKDDMEWHADAIIEGRIVEVVDYEEEDCVDDPFRDWD